MAIAGNEISEFLASATNKFSGDILKLDRMARKWFWIRMSLILVIIVLAIIIGVYAGAAAAWIIAIVGCSLTGLLRFPYFSAAKQTSRHFSKHLAEWMADHRGPLYAKGIRPRPGHGGVFIIFEANAVS
jgi:hypothetical protein